MGAPGINWGLFGGMGGGKGQDPGGAGLGELGGIWGSQRSSGGLGAVWGAPDIPLPSRSPPALGLWIFHGATTQRSLFNRDPRDPRVAGLPTVPTATGQLLLAGGWWGLVRRPDDLGELLMALGWTLPCGETPKTPPGRPKTPCPSQTPEPPKTLPGRSSFAEVPPKPRVPSLPYT
uniref:Delta(14)-sterol reductase TM7SF2 n=1 Tax=Geospiza parvula TaxID=87175 RepID=A0A8U8BIR1_GEOPR